MSQEDRYPLLPSRVNLTLIKERLTEAQNGHKMLKKKVDALRLKHRETAQELVQEKKKIVDKTKDAHLALCDTFMFPLRTETLSALKNAQKQPSEMVYFSTEHVVGIEVPKIFLVSEFDGVELNRNLFSAINEGRAGLEIARELFYHSLSTYIHVASLQHMFIALDQALKKTNRRVNALEKAVIPKMIRTKNYIEEEMEEISKEEFYRLKTICKKKKMHTAENYNKDI